MSFLFYELLKFAFFTLVLLFIWGISYTKTEDIKEAWFGKGGFFVIELVLGLYQLALSVALIYAFSWYLYSKGFL